ncbi:hypothetical protein B0H16DRAFT_1684048 [Mycena metata]|uniref:Uncharacterized protein n=1 Tax=Mycena metata TaxID=1033252 RepID=A0AAD7K3F5_9AGAR|nr:hypothetical protein B0H16DRAFT_1684048 [Mycena metata]
MKSAGAARFFSSAKHPPSQGPRSASRAIPRPVITGKAVRKKDKHAVLALRNGLVSRGLEVLMEAKPVATTGRMMLVLSECEPTEKIEDHGRLSLRTETDREKHTISAAYLLRVAGHRWQANPFVSQSRYFYRSSPAARDTRSYLALLLVLYSNSPVAALPNNKPTTAEHSENPTGYCAQRHDGGKKYFPVLSIPELVSLTPLTSPKSTYISTLYHESVMSGQIATFDNNKSAPCLKARPSPPLTPPTRRRSNSAISSWAALVQPGSPSPRSPRRRPSTSSSRRPSIISRRPSIGHGPAAAGSFINLIDTPTTAAHRSTPSVKEFDLTNLGYSSVFVHFPNTPSTPSPFLQPKSAANPYAHIPIPPIPASPPAKRRGLKHFRSLSALTRTRSKSVSSMPAAAAPPATPKSSKTQFFAVSIAKRKKAQYKFVRPAPLANELAMMQFADGGSLESHAKRVMAHQAKTAGPGVGVGEVFRDGNGGLWWDEDEEWEYAHLLGGEEQLVAGPDEMQWVQFDEQDKENEVSLALAGLAGEERRGSVSTQDSDLDARYLVQPAEDENMVDFVPLTLRRPGMSVLALPSRPRRAAKHLHKPEFLVDAAFGAPRSPKFAAPSKPKGNARRRPAPLKLGRPSHATTAPIRTADVRNDFFASSFAPSPAAPASPLAPTSPLSPTSPVMRKRRMSTTSLAPKAKASVMNVRSLFRRRE